GSPTQFDDVDVAPTELQHRGQHLLGQTLVEHVGQPTGARFCRPRRQVEEVRHFGDTQLRTPVSSARTTAAASLSTCSFPGATSRGNFTSPQLVLSARRSGGTTANTARIRSATSATDSTCSVRTSITPATTSEGHGECASEFRSSA